MNDLPRKEDTILLADAEPYNMGFVVDFLESLQFKTVVADTIQQALQNLQEFRFRAVLADLGIPLLPPKTFLVAHNPLYAQYPGLLVAECALNHNHAGREVMVYSIHEDPQVRELSGRLGFSYILKGRPRIWKQELEALLSPDSLAKPA